MSDNLKNGVGNQPGRLIKDHRKVIDVIFILIFMYWGYGTYDDWVYEQREKEQTLAMSLGFDSVQEMKSLKHKGFNTKTDFNNAEAKKVGFENYDEMKKRVAQGIKTGKELEEAKVKAKSLSFESVDEMIELQSRGFKNKSEKIAKDKADEVERIQKEKAKLINLDYLLETYSRTASIECSIQIEKSIRNNYEWFDNYIQQKFPTYAASVYGPGVLYMEGDRLKFQNATGGWKLMSYSCKYDTQAKKVLSVSIWQQ